MTHGARAALATISLFSAACDARAPTASNAVTADTPTAVAPADSRISPPFDPSSFVRTITNPYLPQTPGTLFRYRSETRDGIEINLVRITTGPKRFSA
jgi:hypothetical protein